MTRYEQGRVLAQASNRRDADQKRHRAAHGDTVDAARQKGEVVIMEMVNASELCDLMWDEVVAWVAVAERLKTELTAETARADAATKALDEICANCGWDYNPSSVSCSECGIKLWRGIKDGST